MDLPDSMLSIGEQLGRGGGVGPMPELFDAHEVFAAELALLFVRPWLAVDHHSRLAADGDHFRVDVGPRSVLLVRESEHSVHALRNACLHAGYRVCDAEEGHADQLYCPYHGWLYALDGRLVDPLLRPEQSDRSRYRLPRYALRIVHGLILVDLSNAAAEPPPAGAVEPGALPDDLAGFVVTGRQRHSAGCNWKYLRQALWSSPGLVFGGTCDRVAFCGPLSFVAGRDGEAALLRLSPRHPGHTEIEVIRMSPADRMAPPDNAGDPLAAAVRRAEAAVAAAPFAFLERPFYEWYWSALALPQSA